MKKSGMNIAMLGILALGFLGCQGPAGPEGPQGPSGEASIGTIFDVTADFNPDNKFRTYFEFPADEIEVFDTDVILVYIKWEESDVDGQPANVWRALPQTIIRDEGLLQYNFDHSFVDVSFFMEGDFDLAKLPEGDRLNQLFRVVIIPAGSVNPEGRSGKVDYNNYNEVVKTFNLKEENIKTFKSRSN